MPFPTSITGAISISKDEDELRTAAEVADRIERMLVRIKARNITHQGTTVRFTGRLDLVSPQSYNYIGSTRIDVEDAGTEIRVIYSASMMRWFFVINVPFALIALRLTFSGPTPFTIALGKYSGLLFVPFGFCVIFLGGYLLAARMFPRWLERGLRRRPLAHRMP
jgi:hypothetical protein